MKLFVTAALGAALLAGCAPFEHGHYTEDVSYRNNVGDPPGTPLVYKDNPAERSTYDPGAYSTIVQQGSSSYGHGTGHHAVNHQRHGYSTAATQQYSYAAPATYSAPVQQSYGSYANATSYLQSATTSTWNGPATHNHGVVATTYGSQKVDADGFLICDIPWPSHGANQIPRY